MYNWRMTVYDEFVRWGREQWP